jgi:K+-transporting ATPase ATPase C chain
MLQHLRPALVSTALFTLLLGVGYPLLITGVSVLAFPNAAHGSMLTRKGEVIGSALIGQGFAKPEYLHPRPSAAGKGYDASASSGSNYGPLNPDLASRIKTDSDALRADTGKVLVPADAVTTSASGLDPDISPAYADLQADRVAKARGADPAAVRSIIVASTGHPLLGFIGQPHVNVLKVNLALDARFPVRHAGG